MSKNNFFNRGAGGSPGGIGDFIFGAVLALIGLYMLTSQVRVTTGFWGRFTLFGGIGISAFGATMIVFMIGVVLLFRDSKSWAGWIITGVALLFTFVGIIANLNVYFVGTSLYVALIIFVLIAGGIGLMLRGLRPR